MSVGSLAFGGSRPPLQLRRILLWGVAKAWIGRSARGKRGIEWRVAGNGWDFLGTVRFNCVPWLGNEQRA